MRTPDSPCRKPWENLLVEVNGDCYFCCFIIRPGGKIGNLEKKDFEDVWNSRKARRIRRAIAPGGGFPIIARSARITAGSNTRRA